MSQRKLLMRRGWGSVVEDGEEQSLSFPEGFHCQVPTPQLTQAQLGRGHP